MNKKKAILCTILFVIALIVILALSSFLKNEKLGVDLFHVIVYSAASLWIGELVVKFYKWLRAEN